MKRALVTGAGGFIGRHLVARLRDEGVMCMTAGVRPGGANHLAFDPGIAHDWTRILEHARPDVVFHLAGASGRAEAPEIFRVNCTWAANLLAAARPFPTRVILIGSAAEYGEVRPEQMPIDEKTPALPRSIYGIAKLAQTQLGLAAAAQGADVVVARLFNVVGPGMPAHLFLPTMARELAAQRHLPPGKRRLIVGNPTAGRDLIPIRPTVEGLLALARASGASGLVCLCSGQPVTNQQLLDGLLHTAQCHAEIVVDPARRNHIDPPIVFGSQKHFTAITGQILSPISESDIGEIWADISARNPDG